MAERHHIQRRPAARIIKLLDGHKLGERSTSKLLLAAGDKYQMKEILATRIKKTTSTSSSFASALPQSDAQGAPGAQV